MSRHSSGKNRIRASSAQDYNFSEYVDTVLYLKKSLIKQFGERLLVVAGDLSNAKIAQINKKL